MQLTWKQKGVDAMRSHRRSWWSSSIATKWMGDGWNQRRTISRLFVCQLEASFELINTFFLHSPFDADRWLMQSSHNNINGNEIIIIIFVFLFPNCVGLVRIRCRKKCRNTKNKETTCTRKWNEQNPKRQMFWNRIFPQIEEKNEANPAYILRG